MIVLGILVFLLLCILFHPFFYRIRAHLENEKKFDAKIFWLFHLIAVTVFYTGGKLLYKVRIVGIVVYSGQIPEEYGIDRKQRMDESSVETERTEIKVKEEAKDQSESNTEKLLNSKLEHEESKNPLPKSEQNRHRKVKKKKKKSMNGDTSSDGKRKWERIQNMASMIRSEAKDEKNQKAVLHILKELKYLFLHFVIPKKISADLSLSTNDPATTGQIIGFCSILPWMYQKNIRIFPDFQSDSFDVRGHMKVSGRITLIYLCISAFRLITDKTIRRLIRRARKIGG